MQQFILIAALVLCAWIIRRDTARRSGLSTSLWIPTIWVAVLASRPISMWLGGGAIDTLDGSPLDRVFFMVMIAASLVVVSRRGVDWASFLSRNWPIILFYGYLLISVAWTNSPASSMKRWIKEVGNIAVVLVILTEADPLQAIRAVFVRCAYLLIPLSVVLLRYFPTVGRFYNTHSGELQVTGVTTQKNSLGAMILVCLLVFFWDWLEYRRPGAPVRPRLERYAAIMLAVTGAWLMYASDSKTAMVSLIMAVLIIAASRLPVLRRRISRIGIYLAAAVIGGYVLDKTFGISASFVANLGRDMTFTGRTDVWRELLNVGTDPIFGTGFMSFWDDMHYRELLPNWVAYSAHSGYIEVYLAGGWLGVGFLALMLLAIAVRLHRALAGTDDYTVVRFAIFVAVLMANFAESNFACMTPIGFLFLLAAIGHAHPQPQLALSPVGLTYAPGYEHTGALRS